jgi:hypothetical protein
VIDYDYFYKDRLSTNERWNERWDLLVSAWDDTERVRRVLELSNADRKDLILHPQYNLSGDGAPLPTIQVAEGEAEGMVAYLDQVERDGLDLTHARICLDITGMMRPHLMFLAKLLRIRGVRSFDVIYAEPSSYREREDTQFNNRDVLQVQEVAGFQGINSTSEVREVLVVGPGFDDFSLQEVIGEKESAMLVEIFGLPSLQADMYQLNVLKAERPNAPRRSSHSPARRFASASDPFAVAGELSAIREKFNREGDNRFYFAPLATKAQALGFALFYMAECENTPASIIYPFTASYAPGTGQGVSGIWRYTVDFDLLDRLLARVGISAAAGQ